MLLMSCSTLAMAQSNDEWFIDHLHIAPLKQVSISYAIPSNQHYMVCMQDSSGGSLASLEWKYKGQSFKGQVGMYQRVALNRDDYPAPWVNGGKTQLADSSGTMVVSNLDSSNEMILSCVYSLDLK